MPQIKLDDILKRSPTDDELDQAIKVIKDVCRQYKNCLTAIYNQATGGKEEPNATN